LFLNGCGGGLPGFFFLLAANWGRGGGGHMVAQLVEGLRFELEGRRFASVLLEFFIDIIIPAALWSWDGLSL